MTCSLIEYRVSSFFSLLMLDVKRPCLFTSSMSKLVTYKPQCLNYALQRKEAPYVTMPSFKEGM